MNEIKYKIGHIVRIKHMRGESRYDGKEGMILHTDDIGQLHGSWGGLALIPGEDEFEVLNG